MKKKLFCKFCLNFVYNSYAKSYYKIHKFKCAKCCRKEREISRGVEA